MATFGYTGTIGYSYTSIEGNIKGTDAVSPANNGTVDSLHAAIYISGWTENVKIKMALYRVSDGAKICESEERTFTESHAVEFETFTVSGSPAVSSASSYYIVVWSETKGGTTACDRKADTGKSYTAETLAYTDWPASYWEPDSTTSDYHLNAYCTYTESAGGNVYQINIGDAWKTIEGMQINIGDAWKTIEGMQINIGDAWKTIF